MKSGRDAQETIASRISASAEKLGETDGTPEAVGEQLNEILNEFLPERFRAMRGSIFDVQGNRSAEFPVVVYDTRGFDGNTDSIPADAAAAVIDVSPVLNFEELRASYKRVISAKTLEKGQPGKTESGYTPVNVIFGIIFSLRSEVSIEVLTEELDRLNKMNDVRVWPDVLVALAQGIANFTIQFSGDNEKVDFLLPSQGISLVIPAYIRFIVRPGGNTAMNRLVCSLYGQLLRFTGDPSPYTMAEVLEGVPQSGIILGAYQCNLSQQLVPVSEEEYVTSRFLSPMLFRVEDPGGNLLSHLQFVPWQDGAFLRLIGKLPLEPFLIFLGRPDASVINRPSAKLSDVMNITFDDFKQMVERCHAKSNLIVKPEDRQNWVVSKVADEGTRIPFYARLYAGMLEFRDQTLNEQQVQSFDALYNPVLTSLESARSAVQEIIQATREHKEKISSGEIVAFRDRTASINENIDRLLRKNTESFLNSAVRSIKDGIQPLVKELGLDIGFLYKKESAFETGIEKLEQTDPALAAYLKATRQDWSEQLIWQRNEMHRTWVLPLVEYKGNFTLKSVEMVEPTIAGQLVSQFVSESFNRVCCFVEEVTAHALQQRMPESISITEIPIGERKPEFPKRFQNALETGGSPIWCIVFHRLPFDQA